MAVAARVRARQSPRRQPGSAEHDDRLNSPLRRGKVRRMVLRDRIDDTTDDSAFRERLLITAMEVGRTLDERECSRMTAHYRLLRQWGKKMNLTGLKNMESILRRHFLEPIAVSDLIEDQGTLLDIGSGNGFPAVPLAVLHPGLRLILVESSEKRSAFLWAVLRALELKGAQVETRRACRRADLADFLPVRWLTFRGVRALELLAGPGPDLLEKRGRLLAFLSEADALQLRSASTPGLCWSETHRLPYSPGDAVAVFQPTGLIDAGGGREGVPRGTPPLSNTKRSR